MDISGVYVDAGEYYNKSILRRHNGRLRIPSEGRELSVVAERAPLL